MTLTTETRPRFGDADRVKEVSLDRDHSGNTPVAAASQEAKAAARDLLRSHAYETAEKTAEWALSVARLIACDDGPGLRYCASKFVSCARETAQLCKQLLGEAEGAP